MAQGADFRSRITLEGGDKIATDLQKIGTEGDKAFSDVGKAAANSTSQVNTFARATEGMARKMAALRTASSNAGRDLAQIGKHASDFGSSLTTAANNIVPRFKEIVGLGAIGGFAGFFALFEATTKWGHDLKENADQIGVTVDQLGAMSKAAKLAGLDVEQLIQGLTKFNIALQGAADERDKALIKLTDLVAGGKSLLPVEIFRGAGQNLDKDIDELKQRINRVNLTKEIKDLQARMWQNFTPGDRLQLQLKKLELEKAGPSAGPARLIELPSKEEIAKVGAILETEFKRLAILFPDVAAKFGSPEAFKDLVLKARAAGGDMRKQIDDELSKLGVDLKPDTIGDALRRGTKGFKDIFAELKIPVFDQTTGGIRQSIDALGDFLDAFQKLSITEQSQLVRKTFGRGFAEFIPIMRKGRAGLLEFSDALKQAGVETPFAKDIEALDVANKSLRRLDGAITAIRKSFVVPFADVFSPILDGIAASLQASQPAIKAWAAGIAESARTIVVDLQAVWQGAAPQTDFGKGFKEALDAITLAIGFVQQAFAALTVVMQPVADVLNSILGPDYSARTYALAAAMLYFSGILPALIVGLKAVGAALAFMTTTPVGLALTAIGLIALTIYQNWDKLVPLFNMVKDTLVGFASWISEGFVQVWNTVLSTVMGYWQNFTNFIDRQVQYLKGLINSLKNLLTGSAGTATNPNVAAPMATGGQVPGSGGGDTFPAMLTPGEFVMRRSVVDTLGAPFFAALNRGMGSFLPRNRFATGGLVATGGGGGAAVHLHLGGQEFALSGQTRVVNALVTEAHRQRMRSGGLKPSWYGGRVLG